MSDDVARWGEGSPNLTDAELAVAFHHALVIEAIDEHVFMWWLND